MRIRTREKDASKRASTRLFRLFSSGDAPSLPLDRQPEMTWIDFSSPTNPLGTPPVLVEAMKDAVAEGIASHQPDRSARAFRASLSELYGLPPESFICGSSASDLLRAVMQTIEPGEVGAPVPCLPDYRSAAAIAGHRFVPLESACGTGSGDLARVAAERGVSGVIVGNPSFPTSRLLARKTLLELLDACSWVIVDERYVELTLGGESAAPLTESRTNLLVIRSLSESFALPGTPVSYCIGNPSVIECIRGMFDSSSISMFADVLGRAALQELGHLERTRDLLDSEIPWLQCMLGLVPGVRVSPAEAGFLLCRYRADENAGALARDVRELASRLKTAGYVVRLLDGMPGADKNGYCVAVRSREENERLVRAMRAAVACKDGNDS